MRRSLFLAALLALVVVVPASAAKPDRKPHPQALAVAATAISIDNPTPAHGDTVTLTANVSGISAWTLWGECWQGTTQVLWFGGVTRRGDQTFTYSVTLDSVRWAGLGGGADCWAAIRNYDLSTDLANPAYEEPRLLFSVAE